MIDIKATFEKFDDEFLKFERIESPVSKRPDLCAFLTLDRLVPGKRDMVTAASHDEICLEINPEDLTKVATEDDILLLVRCGVRIDSEYDSLVMFV